jgi:hypothetical protein
MGTWITGVSLAHLSRAFSGRGFQPLHHAWRSWACFYFFKLNSIPWPAARYMFSPTQGSVTPV